MKLQEKAARTGGYKVRDVMQRNVISVSAEMTLVELAQVLTQRMISGAPVVDEEGEVVGVVSLADLVANTARTHAEMQPNEARPQYYRDVWMEEEVMDGFTVEDFSSNMKVMDIMTPVVYVIGENDSLSELVNLMLGARIHRALVTNGESVVGIVTTMDLIRIIPDLATRSLGSLTEG